MCEIISHIDFNSNTNSMNSTLQLQVTSVFYISGNCFAHTWQAQSLLCCNCSSSSPPVTCLEWAHSPYTEGMCYEATNISMHGERFMAILTYFVSYRAETVRYRNRERGERILVKPMPHLLSGGSKNHCHFTNFESVWPRCILLDA